MKKIELEIVALSHSITQTHSYAVVLGEVNGLRRLPIVIGGFEAQAIAVALEKMQPSRPLTHACSYTCALPEHWVENEQSQTRSPCKFPSGRKGTALKKKRGYC